jgi:DNA-binding CsgD family transcriptional regulator
VARHRTPEERRELGERARALRAEGRSQREILRELRVGEDLLRQLLRGIEVPDALRRPRAKDEVRARAVELRLAGRTYDEIANELGVSKSSCSLWLRDLPHPEDDPVRKAEAQARRTEALRTRALRDRGERDRRRAGIVDAASWSVGQVSARDLVLAAALSYWCEGSKAKPWNRTPNVQWMNSDPMLVRLFLEGLRVMGVPTGALVPRLHIHETADEPAARQWWAEQTGLPVESFRRSTIKRHKPKPGRHNTGDRYRGCLCVTIAGGRTLYDSFEGVVSGLAHAERAPRDDWQDDAALREPQQARDVPSALV